VRAIEWTHAQTHTLDGDVRASLRFETENKWVGFLGERGFARWLTEREVEFEHFGGLDGKPDFIVAGHPVLVNAQQLEAHPWSSYSFAGWSSPLLYMLGQITREAIRAVGDFHEPGSTWWAKAACWRVPLGELMAPNDWLATL
jgi:hypothetical protein